MIFLPKAQQFVLLVHMLFLEVAFARNVNQVNIQKIYLKVVNVYHARKVDIKIYKERLAVNYALKIHLVTLLEIAIKRNVYHVRINL